MKIGFLVPSILFVSCLQNPNSAPDISSDQIGNLKSELRLAKYSVFTKNELDTLPKNILTSDSAIKSMFENEQINAWLLMADFPKGVQATIVVNVTETRGGKTSERRMAATAKMNTCCSSNWNGTTWIQLQVPFWNHPEDLPFKLVYEAKIQEIAILKDSITIL
jgi:hypothetical protein